MSDFSAIFTARAKNLYKHGAVSAAYLAVMGLDPNTRADVQGGGIAVIANTLGDSTAAWLTGNQPGFNVISCELSKVMTAGIQSAIQMVIQRRKKASVNYREFCNALVTSMLSSILYNEGQWMYGAEAATNGTPSGP